VEYLFEKNKSCQIVFNFEVYDKKYFFYNTLNLMKFKVKFKIIRKCIYI